MISLYKFGIAGVLAGVLSEEDVWLISRFVFYRKNWLTRLLLLFDGKIKYNGFESNLFYVLKLLRGGV